MSAVGSCPHCQADDVIAELCEHLDPSVAVGRRAGFSLESLWLSRGSAGLTAAISTKTPPLASGEVVSTSPASEQVFVVTAGRRAGYLLESFELSWGPAGLAVTAVSAASAVDHRLERSRIVQPNSDIIASELSKDIVSVLHAESDERFVRSVTVHCPCANTLDSSVL